jgi:hypothetical protein
MATIEGFPVGTNCWQWPSLSSLSGVNYFSRSTTTISPDDDNYKLADRVTVQAGCGRQLKKVFKILQLDLDIA